MRIGSIELLAVFVVLTGRCIATPVDEGDRGPAERAGRAVRDGPARVGRLASGGGG